MQRVQRFILRWDGRVSEISWLELGVLLKATSIVSLTFIQNRLRDAHKGQFVLAEVVVVQLLEIYQSVSSDPPLCVCVCCRFVFPASLDTHILRVFTSFYRALLDPSGRRKQRCSRCFYYSVCFCNTLNTQFEGGELYTLTSV